MNKIQAILSKLQPVGQAAGKDFYGATSNVRKELGNLVGEVGTTADTVAEGLKERAVNRILQDMNFKPSASLQNTMAEVSSNRGITNNLDLARQLQQGGNVVSPELLGLGAGEAVARAVAARPGAALATAGGTGAVGGLALITASGQALADLGNFLAGGQQNQGQRDNVLRS